jgi:hypothetical protein
MMHAYAAGMGAARGNALVLALPVVRGRQQPTRCKRADAHDHEV